MIHDITDRKQSEGLLIKSEQRFRQLAENSLDLITELDIDGRFTYINQAGMDIMGRNKETLITSTILSFVHPDEQQSTSDAMQLLSQGSSLIDFENRYIIPSGEEVWISWRAVPNMKKRMIFAIGRDVSIQKRSKAQLRIAKDNAEAASRSKSEFLATMSHEIRTPMNGILGMAELLLSSELDKQQSHQAEIILRSGKSLLGIINDILDISKIEAGQLTIIKEPLDLSKVIKRVFDVFLIEIQKKQIDLTYHIHPKNSSMFFLGDAGRIRQILLNLVGNAVKFTNKGTVEVHVFVNDNGIGNILSLEVRNSGIGIPPDVRSRLFQPFFQIDGSNTRKFGGTGLGLTIVKRLVDMMDGRISVENASGKGAVFRVELGLQKLDQATILSLKSQSATNCKVAQSFKGKPYILVVDDGCNPSPAIDQAAISREVSSSLAVRHG